MSYAHSKGKGGDFHQEGNFQDQDPVYVSLEANHNVICYGQYQLAPYNFWL